MIFLRYVNYSLLLALVWLGFACGTKSDVDAFKEASYNLVSVDAVQLNGINLLEKRRAEDFSFQDAAVLFSAFSSNKLSAFSTLNLNVDLPEGSEERTMKVTQLKWQLLVDGQHAAQGLVSEAVELRNGLNTVSVSTPITLASENGQPNLNNLIRLATLLAQEDKSKRPEVVLQIKPTIQTSIGPFESPAFINIKK
ncbi:hypothetical protein [Botryobacter ruber]|uniref:hypothetical protein n=1 Tax=Botryobacter ruber TaxID=2171629 RepID=UPI000E0ADE13|nr:hypothetical protein [Botryobacter ruber]